MADQENKQAQNGPDTPNASKFMDKVKEMAETVDKTVSEQIESIKIKSKINALNDEIDDLYRRIGVKVYQSAEQSILKSAFEAEIKGIEERFESIHQYLGRAAQIRGVVVCPDCGKECRTEDTFCSKCGKKLQ